MKTLLARVAAAGTTIGSFLLPLAAKAQFTVSDDLQSIQLGSKSPELVVANIVNWALGVLALIAVILVLAGGFLWMTAAGNEEKIERAKKLLTAAVVGLVIILAAWGITIYALNILTTATGTGE